MSPTRPKIYTDDAKAAGRRLVRCRQRLMPQALYRAVLLCLLLSATGCTTNVPVPLSDQSDRVKPRPEYVVRHGDSLYAVAWVTGIDFNDLARWNGLTDPYLIKPGQVLALYETGRSRTTSAADRQSAKKNHQSIAKQTDWTWPAAGKIIRRFDPTAGRNGIDIAGSIGDDVVSTAAGRVVYAGTGLRGYGRLLIVKHSDKFLSAYAHNEILLVAENEPVRAGQVIAKLGQSKDGESKLHFEIRQFGKPVDPIRMLPTRRKP